MREERNNSLIKISVIGIPLAVQELVDEDQLLTLLEVHRNTLLKAISAELIMCYISKVISYQ